MPLQPLVSCWRTTLGPTDTTSVNMTNAKQAYLSLDHPHNELGSPMVAQATPNMSPNSPFANFLHDQDKQTHSRTSPHLWWAWARHQMTAFSLHEGGHQHIQGRRRPHNMQRGTNPHWHPRQPRTIPNTVDATTGRWQPRCPSKQARKALYQTNSVYDLSLTKQAIKWMHAICGYLVNWLGSMPSKRETTWAGQCWLNAMSKSTIPKQSNLLRGIWAKQERTYGPPKLRHHRWKHATPPTSTARRCATCRPRHAWYAKPCSPTKQATSPPNLFMATSTSWLCWKLTATPSLLSPWRTAKMPRWYRHTMHSCYYSNGPALSPRNMSLTMRYPKTWRITFVTRANWIWNWCHKVATDTTQQR